MANNNVDTNHVLTYRPTSLEFINRPNPVEPHAVQEKHPLNGTPRLEKTSKEEFLRLLHNKDVERPAKRRKSGDPKSLDLPKLPEVRNGTKRLRIPPTLSGLHQPPPDAGLLPSMSVQQPLRLSDNSPPGQSELSTDKRPAEDDSHSAGQPLDRSTAPPTRSNPKRKHKKWSADETTYLLKGVAKFGIGQWTKILNCQDYHFQDRTALDLKDRFRVCCPEEYRTSRKVKTDRSSTTSSTQDVSSNPKGKSKGGAKKAHSVSSSQLQSLGIDAPFEKSKRRQRTAYNDEQDQALLRGFKKHGNAWAVIRQEEEILKERTATDLRDRFRTRYPDEYAKAGLTPRPEPFPKKAEQAAEQDGKGAKSVTSTKEKMVEKLPEKEIKVPHPAPQRRIPPTSLLQTDDVFWGAPFEPPDIDPTPITLDRGILDWAYDIHRPAAPNDNNGKATDIDPLATLNLPRPTVTSTSGGSGATSAPAIPNAVTSASANALPSLAAITAGFWHGDVGSVEEHLELPSLLGGFGALEGDNRAAGLYMSMEELLS